MWEGQEEGCYWMECKDLQASKAREVQGAWTLPQVQVVSLEKIEREAEVELAAVHPQI